MTEGSAETDGSLGYVPVQSGSSWTVLTERCRGLDQEDRHRLLSTCTQFLHIRSPQRQWRIQLWAHLVPPNDQNLGLVVAAQSSLPQTRGRVFI